MKSSLRLRSLLLGGLLAGALTAHATNPVLTFRGLVTTGDNTAFIDQVQILSGATGNTVVATAIVNGSFEASDPLARSTYGYVPTGAVWNFGAGSGIATNGTGFGPTNVPNGTQVAFVQGGGQFQQTLTLPAGNTDYRVRFLAAQRFYTPTNVQQIQVLVDGVVMSPTSFQPGSTTYTQFTTGTFRVATSTPFGFVSLAPTRNQLGVDRTGYVTQTFTEPVNAVSAYDGSIFSSQFGGLLKTKQPLTISGNQVTYVPNRYFKAGEVVSVTIPNTVVSNALGQATNNAQVYQFTVATTGSGTGTFNGATNPTTGTDPGSVAVGDVDGDGRLDLVVANRTTDNVSVFRNLGNTGSGGALAYAGKVDFALQNNATPYAVALGDIDGDGRLDIVTANLNGTVSILRNTTTAAGPLTSSTFAARVSYNSNIYNDPAYALALGDMDGDGDLDIAVATYINDNNTTEADMNVLRNIITPAAVLASNGLPASTGALTSASFATASRFILGNSERFGIALGDLDSDGKLDIVTANYGPNTVGIYRNLTTSPAALDFGDEEALVPVGTSPYAVAIGDVNGDGRLDIVTANRDGDNVSVLQNAINSPGAFSAASGFPTAGRSSIALGNGTEPISVALGDFNADGRLDIITANYANGSGRTVSTIMRNSNNLGFATPVATALSTTTNFGPRSIALGDLDGDGDLDFATANLTPNTVSFRVNGTSATVLPLPVELVSFAARCNGAGTLLTWRTASEKNSAGFDVQRSADGKTFKSIAAVESQGNSASGGTYSTTDERAPASAYYRLRLADVDGTATYSPVVTATCATPVEAAAGLTLVPNPAQGHVQVLGAREAVQLLDLTGRVLRQQASPESLSLEGLAPGVYLVRSGTQTARLQVQ